VILGPADSPTAAPNFAGAPLNDVFITGIGVVLPGAIGTTPSSLV